MIFIIVIHSASSHPFEGQCNPINAHQIMTIEVPNDVLTIYNQHAMLQDDMDPLLHMPELQGAFAIDTTFDIVTMVRLWWGSPTSLILSCVGFSLGLFQSCSLIIMKY